MAGCGAVGVYGTKQRAISTAGLYERMQDSCVLIYLSMSILILFLFLSQVQYLGDKGGTTVYQTVGLVLKELMTSRLGLRFNMNGATRHGKRGLRRTKLFVVLYRE